MNEIKNDEIMNVQTDMDEAYAVDDRTIIDMLLMCGHALRRMPERGGARVRVLDLLDGESCSQKVLTEALGIQPGSASELLSKMEAEGLIAREPLPTDRRGMKVSLTEKGLQKLNEDRPFHDLLSCFSDEEKQALAGYLKRLLDHWHEELLPPPRHGARAPMGPMPPHGDRRFAPPHERFDLRDDRRMPTPPHGRFDDRDGGPMPPPRDRYDDRDRHGEGPRHDRREVYGPQPSHGRDPYDSRPFDGMDDQRGHGRPDMSRRRREAWHPDGQFRPLDPRAAQRGGEFRPLDPRAAQNGGEFRPVGYREDMCIHDCKNCELRVQGRCVKQRV